MTSWEVEYKVRETGNMDVIKREERYALPDIGDELKIDREGYIVEGVHKHNVDHAIVYLEYNDKMTYRERRGHDIIYLITAGVSLLLLPCVYLWMKVKSLYRRLRGDG